FTDFQSNEQLFLFLFIMHNGLKDYNTAKAYFEEAMKNDVTSISIPHFYIKCLLHNEDYEEAEKLITYSLTLKGINKADILFLRSVLKERKGKVKKALKILSEVREHSFDEGMVHQLEDRKKFLKGKISRKKKKKA
ncbi:tetratricopeptide repeat protein, partial [Elizabethkingia anophelis]